MLPTNPTLQWVDPSASHSYWVYVGSGQGRQNYYNSGLISGGNSSDVLSGLPGNNNPVWIRLWYRAYFSAPWQYIDANYTIPPILLPENQSTLTGPDQAFKNLADFYLLMWVAGDSDSTPRFTLERSNNWLAVRDRTGVGRGGQYEYHLTPAWLMEAALTRPEFVQIFRDRVQLQMLTSGGALTVDESIARLDNRLPTVNAAIDAEAACWGNTWREPGFDRTDWEPATQTVRNCFELRTSVMLDYLAEDGLVP